MSIPVAGDLGMNELEPPVGKMNIELSDEEIMTLWDKYEKDDTSQETSWESIIAQASRKKIVEELNIYVEAITKDNNGTHEGNVLIDPVVIAALNYWWQAIRKGLE